VADVNEKVMAFVEDALRKDPEQKSSELFEKAKEIDPSISELSSRQFHAQYPLQIHRRNAPAKPKASRKSRSRRTSRKTKKSADSGAVQKAAVRGVLQRFAKDLTASSDPQKVVEAMIGLDDYVEEIVRAF
jgi:hypothetical protein